MATVVTTTTSTSKVGRKSLISRTLQRCKSGLSAGGSVRASPAGCFSVYVGPERERFVVRAERANHPLFRRLLDDAEREYGYAAQGPLALPGCDVDAFLDVLWQVEHDEADGGGGQQFDAAASSPVCGLHSGSKGRAAGYRMLVSPRSSSPVVGRRR
ncbi:hypothetical protein C2845_PM14G14230 [Panicum miliaceum]|uniref:Auxin-responsive protein SAUR71-like n=1 Tax=Panicum miliaceum TaxID=4540 RepID=A0A3L6PN68_PANMI|nr:hypothetical protein C2845_PM14G14230 [Panicum miliaceum]